jgi:hypothetical protein
MAADNTAEFPAQELVTTQLNYGFSGGNGACRRVDISRRYRLRATRSPVRSVPRSAIPLPE